MVCISASVLSKSGKILLARSFLPITRNRLEGYLNAFPKLIGNDPLTQQHTFVDTEHVRYVYQPLDAFYVVLITNISSNIIEDIDTLRLLAKLVTDAVSHNRTTIALPNSVLGEDELTPHIFDLLFAFDECIATNCGYKDHVTLSQVSTYTVMDSHEEKLQKVITESKMSEARSEAARKAETIDKLKAEQRKQDRAQGIDRYGGSGSGNGGSSGSSSGTGITSGVGSGSVPSYDDDRGYGEVKAASKVRDVAKPSKPSGAKGMSLNKSKRTDEQFMAALGKEEKLAPMAPAGRNAVGSSAAAAGAHIRNDAVRILCEESVVIECDRDGGVKRAELKGEIKLSVFDPEYAHIVLHTNNKLNGAEEVKCRLHPKMNKTLWSSKGHLGLADASKAFPVGSDNALPIIKWRKTCEETDIPITVSVWPSASDDGCSVSCEFTAEKGLPMTDVRIIIPCKDAPEVASIDGDYKFDQRTKTLTWSIADTTERANGAMEFTVGTSDVDSFFPLSVTWECATTLSGIHVDAVVRSDDAAAAVEFSAQHKLTAEKYTVE